ncbi:helix-turn-helix domain-containing protein, partial [Acinetobacter baumannii]
DELAITTFARGLIQELKNNGLLEIKKAVETVAQHLGISRASAYLYVKET